MFAIRSTPALIFLAFTGLLYSCHSSGADVPDSLEKAGQTVWINGGTYNMGNTSQPDASPVIEQQIDGFWMQKYEVTNAQFEQFVTQTGYITQAEKQGGSYVFVQNHAADSTSIPGTPWWVYTEGADWRHPEDKNSNFQTKKWNPVTHVAYADACAYCDWLQMRLPTEAEWEYVAQAAGDMARQNIWQGNFPFENKTTDGFEGTAPVGSFPADKNGLHDIRGNVWEWCADPYHAYWYTLATELPIAARQKGPERGYDPSSPYEETRIIRGGSFLCSENYCTGYLPFTRMRSSTSQTFGHIGFRCVKSGK